MIDNLEEEGARVGFLLCVFYRNIPYSGVERFLLQLFELYMQGLEKQSQIEFTDYLRSIQAKTLLSSALLASTSRFFYSDKWTEAEFGSTVIRVSSKSNV